jgi:hypothetical protein
MVFEDAHWIDPSSRELLDLTLDRVARLPVLLIVTFRPEFQHAWNGQPHLTTLALNRLGGREGAALVEGLAGNDLAREIIGYESRPAVERTGSAGRGARAAGAGFRRSEGREGAAGPDQLWSNAASWRRLVLA